MTAQGRPGRTVPPRRPETWWRRNWHEVMNWAVSIPAAGFFGPYLHPEFAGSPAWRWMTGLGLAALITTWVLRSGR